MQILITVVLLIGSTGFIVWWDTQNAPLALSPTETPLSTTSTEEEPVLNTDSTPNGNDFSLDMTNDALTKVPNSVFEQTKVESLNLSHNVLSGSLQGEIRLLQNLKTLDLSYNNFTGVPAEVGQLKKLETLNLSYNKLTGLPHELGNLPSLKVLNVSGNNYSEADLAIIKEMLPKTTTIITK